MTKARLVILRHGQTDYNAQHLMTGQRDIPLNQAGEAEAREAGALIKDVPFDKVYSSSLSRAFNTAAIALKAAGQDLPVEKRKELIEQNNGDYTGRNRTDADIINKVMFYDVPLPGGECLKDVVERAKKFFDAEVQPRLARGENVLIVTHYVVMYAFDIALSGEPIPLAKTLNELKKFPNASPMVCEYEDGVLKDVSFLENPETTKVTNGNAKIKPCR